MKAFVLLAGLIGGVTGGIVALALAPKAAEASKAARRERGWSELLPSAARGALAESVSDHVAYIGRLISEGIQPGLGEYEAQTVRSHLFGAVQDMYEFSQGEFDDGEE